MTEGTGLLNEHSTATASGSGTRPAWFGTAIGIVLSIVGIALTLRGVSLTHVTATLTGTNVWWVLLALTSILLTVGAKAVRWMLLFRRYNRPSLQKSFSALSIGMFLNSFAPARIGDVARAYVVGDRDMDSTIGALGTVAVEKLIDLVFLIVTVGIILSQIPLPDWIAAPARVLAVLAFLAMGGLAAFLRQQDRFLGLLAQIGRLLPTTWQIRLMRIARAGTAGVDPIRDKRVLASALFWSVIVWTFSASTNYLVFRAMGMSTSVWAALLLLVVLQVGVAVPSSAGRIGVFHYLVIVTLAVFSIDRDVALSYGIILHLVVYLPMLVLGVWYFWRERLAWATLASAAGRVRSLGKNSA